MFRIILNPLTKLTAKAVATIGNFDGLHLGHIQLINQLKSIGEEKNYRKVVITFEPLPLDYFREQKVLPRLPHLSLLRDKYLILKKLGFIDELVILRFDTTLANLTPSQFIQNILQDQLNIVHVAIGHDFKFGKGGIGGVVDFMQYNIAVQVVPPYLLDKERISSSLIRDLAKINDLVKVRTYLGRNLQYTSHVIHGKQLGRKFGVPTINLSLGKNSPALWGIYIALVYIEGVTYNAVASIGKNPTVTDTTFYKLEAHLLDIDLDLYGKIATVEILHFLRVEEKFPDTESLFKQIHKDLSNARAYFKLNSIEE